MLKTYPGSDLNDISNTLKKYLEERKVKPKDTVKYRLLNGTRNIDPNRKKEDEYLFPSVINIPINGLILDPGDEVVNEKGEVTSVKNDGSKQIGAIRSFDDKTKQPVYKKFYVRPQKGDGGIFMLRGNVVEDMDIYDALELSNANASNPYRDVSQDAIFERVNDVAEGQARSKKRNFLFDSLNAIRGWTYDEMRVVGAGYNLSPLLEKDVLKDKLEEIAEKAPEEFFKAIDSVDMKTKALIKLAKDAGVIEYIAHENKWVYVESQEIITLLDRKEGITETEQFALFLKNSANGDKIKGQIEKLVAAKRKAGK